MKNYFENRDFVIPFRSVMFVKYEIAGTIFIFFSAQFIAGGNSVESIMLDGTEAENFLAEYKEWLDKKWFSVTDICKLN